jgi:hypothetical protein
MPKKKRLLATLFPRLLTAKAQPSGKSPSEKCSFLTSLHSLSAAISMKSALVPVEAEISKRLSKNATPTSKSAFTRFV